MSTAKVGTWTEAGRRRTKQSLVRDITSQRVVRTEFLPTLELMKVLILPCQATELTVAMELLTIRHTTIREWVGC
jgi:hypothetical protein